MSGPAQTPAAELPDTLGAAEGRLGVSVHITWPDPSPSLKIEVHCIDLDWAEVSQLTRGYLGLQCQSPNSSSMSVCILLSNIAEVPGHVGLKPDVLPIRR